MTNKTISRSSEVSTRVSRTAEIAGVSTRTVLRVISGDQEVSDETRTRVLSIYHQLAEGESLLIKAVKQAVPFN
jgi:hypothetical protein